MQLKAKLIECLPLQTGTSKNGEWKKDKDENEIGKELLISKATGYISYVRGENPYTFPFRVYPDRFAIDNTFKNLEEYPNYQLNGRRIPNNRKIEKLSIYLNVIGEYQQMGYNYIIDRLRRRGENIKTTRKGVERRIASFASLKSFGYTDLQIPIEALNIIYPYPGLEELVKRIEPIKYIEDDDADGEDYDADDLKTDISPTIGKPEKDIVEEIDTVMSIGPQLVTTINTDINPLVPEVLSLENDIKKNDIKKNDIKKNDIKIINKSLELSGFSPGYSSVFSPDSLDDNYTIKEIQKSNPKTILQTKSNPKSNPKTILQTKSNPKSNPKTILQTPISSFSSSLVPKNNVSGLHIIEGDTKSQYPSEKNSIKEYSMSTISNKRELNGGADSASDEMLYIDPKELTGGQGLKRTMDFIDTKTPSVKGNFEYKKGIPHIFDNNEIGKYSTKIKNICDSIYNKKTGIVSDGIILIYSAYIDGGVIPMSLDEVS